MLLAVDVGNTQIVLGLFAERTLTHHWRLASRRERTVDEYGLLVEQLLSLHGVDRRGIKGAIISSVVPPLQVIWQEMVESYFGLRPLLVEPGIKTGMPILYDNPREVGADRIVNAVAAIEKYGTPAIVVDFGTATTFDVISEKGEYLGGAIVPGLQISAEALFQKASKLPRVEVTRPRSIVGRNTVASMHSGLYFGYLCLIEGMLTRIKAEMRFDPVVVATGGLARTIGEGCL